MSIFVIGDIHGCFETFLVLKKKLPSNAKICLVGDLIDRGPRSKEMLDYVIKNKILCVKGNHEEFLEYSRLNARADAAWLSNGGREALNSYRGKNHGIDIKLIKEHQAFVKTLPIYLDFDIKNNDGRRLVVSHSIIHKMWGKEENQNFSDTVLWGRQIPKDKHPAIYNIFGHTPSNKPIVTETYANIDTGCCFMDMGFLTAIQFPEMNIIQQRNLD